MAKKKRKDQVKTLFARMLTTYLTVMIGGLLLSGITVGALLQSYTLREKKETMARELSVIVQLYANMRSGMVAPETTEGELMLIARHYDGLITVFDAGGAVATYSSGTKWSALASQTLTDQQLQSLLYSATKLDSSGVRFTKEQLPFQTLSAVKGVVEQSGQPAYAVRLCLDLTAQRSTMHLVYLEVLLVTLIAILIAVIAVYYTTMRMTKPFMEINDTVQKYSKGDYNIRIPISSTDEASQLALSFNSMADQLKDLEATRRSFVANVSHELRSPLTSMKGFLEAMQDGTISEQDYEKYIGIVLSETRRMTLMVNDLLDLARIESGKTALKLEIFDINELIRRTLLTFEARIYEKSMEVDVKFAQEQYYVEADNTQIGQVLRNIIDNAIKYSPDHSRLRIATYAMKREVYVSIADSGQGIPEEDVPHVFDRFYKVEKAHTRSPQTGTGLGLSIVKRIIDQHGQTITLKSARGRGSTFTFTLKRAPSPKRMQQDGGRKNGSTPVQ